MGNKVTQSAYSGVFRDFEHINGNKLFEAIRNNDAEKTQEAINYAKQEFQKPVVRNSNLADYNDMVEYMIKYLTKQYDIGDGLLFPKTPLEYCKDKAADKAQEVIMKNLTNLQYHGNTLAANIMSPTVGEISKDRVKEAKARLQEIRNNHPTNKK